MTPDDDEDWHGRINHMEDDSKNTYFCKKDERERLARIHQWTADPDVGAVPVYLPADGDGSPVRLLVALKQEDLRVRQICLACGSRRSRTWVPDGRGGLMETTEAGSGCQGV